MERASKWFVTVLLGAVGIAAAPPDAFAGITATGDVDPNDPATWTSSTVAYVGKTAVGSVTVDGNSDVVSDYAYVGYESGATGEVTVDGAGSTWTNWFLCVGPYGNGTLSIANGGAVSNTYGVIGYLSDSTGAVTVDGNGSTWTNTESLCVGYDGNGTLNITNGGAVSDGDGYIGYGSGSTGEVTVDGPGSTWTNWPLYVGGYGNGTLSIANGGAVSSYYAYIGYSSGSTGEVTVDGAGSTWTNDGDLDVGCDGSATLNITSGGAVTAGGSMRIDAGAQLRTGDASITAGALEIEGNWIIDGSQQTTWLDGNLSFALSGALDLGRSRIVVDYSGSGVSPIADVEAWIAGGTIGSSAVDGNKAIGYFDDMFTDTVRAAFTWRGDVDCDFDVDLDDLTILGTYYDTLGGMRWYNGDVNKDGNVDLDDLTLLGTYYNRVPGRAGPIPEPGAACLLGVVALGLLRRRRGSA